MTKEEAKTILDRFNAWRKGWGDDFPYEAKQISVAIDVAISALSAPLPHQDGASADDVVKATLMGYVDPNKVAKISGELMRVLQSETAKVVADKDKRISELIKESNHLRSSEAKYIELVDKIDAHRTRLIESVKKWGGAWRTCRAELKEAKRSIAELEKSQKAFGIISGKDAARFKQRHEASIQKIDLKTPDLKGYDIDKI